MEEQQMTTALERPLSAQDQELFERVWRRVMPEEERSPIAMGPAQNTPTQTAPAQNTPTQVTPMQSAPMQNASAQNTSMQSAPSQGDSSAARQLLPMQGAQQYDLPSLGVSSMGYAQPLREMMDSAHGGWQSYQSLARRAQGQNARSLSALAAEQQQNMRRLGAVYFLLTGERFHHLTQHPVPTGPLGSALREMFNREQSWAQSYSLAAQNNPDPCLEALFLEMHDGCHQHMNSIRAILERM